MIIWQQTWNLEQAENYPQGSIYMDRYSLIVQGNTAKDLETSSQEIQDDSLGAILNFKSNSNPNLQLFSNFGVLPGSIIYPYIWIHGGKF